MHPKVEYPLCDCRICSWTATLYGKKQLNKGLACASQLETAKAKTAEDNHTVEILIARPGPAPAQALLKGHKDSSHSIIT